MSSDILQVWEAIQTTLREIGQEALVQGKYPYGLRTYCDYYREKYPESFEKYRCEEVITEGLAQGLYRKKVNGQIVNACTERRYPFGGRCDLVVNLNGINLVWIECKAAYTDDLSVDKKGKICDYNAESPSLWRDGMWKKTVDGIGYDIEKLKKLAAIQPKQTEYIGVLLLGFDRKNNPIDEKKLYKSLPSELQMTPWSSAHYSQAGITEEDVAPERASKGFRQRLWFGIVQ